MDLSKAVPIYDATCTRLFHCRLPFSSPPPAPLLVLIMTKSYLMNGLIEKVESFTILCAISNARHPSDAKPGPGLPVRVYRTHPVRIPGWFCIGTWA
jgi:hypothetical protein